MAKPTCNIDGCDDPVHGRGWCRSHYMRWWRHGDAEHPIAEHPAVCSVEGCANARVCRGWCRKHYNRWQRHGDPFHTERDIATGTLEDRFWAKVDRGGPDECWLWTAHIDRDGYGRFERIGAHRWAYEFAIGPIPDGMQIDHLCRVRRCVNPAHLETVTLAENVLRGQGVTAQQARQTHCKRGHPLPAAVDGRRVCTRCS